MSNCGIHRVAVIVLLSLGSAIAVQLSFNLGQEPAEHGLAQGAATDTPTLTAMATSTHVAITNTPNSTQSAFSDSATAPVPSGGTATSLPVTVVSPPNINALPSSTP